MLLGVTLDWPERRVLTFKQGQYGGTHYYQLFDMNGDDVDLTGGTVTFRYRTPSGTVCTTIGTLTLETASDGKCYWVPGSTAFNTVGGYVGEFRAAWSSKTYYSPTFSVQVERKMPDT